MKVNGKTEPKNRIADAGAKVARRFEINPLSLARVTVTLTGDSPLMVQAFSKKAKDEMIEAQTSTKAKPKKRPPRKIKDEIEAAKVLDARGKPCVPAIWIKCALVNAAMRYYEVRSSFLKGVVRVLGSTTEKISGDAAIPLKFKRQGVDERVVRLQDMRRTAYVRYRPVYFDWSLDVTIEWDQSAVDADALIEFLRRAGFSIGLGEYRIEKGGDFGAFSVSGGAR